MAVAPLTRLTKTLSTFVCTTCFGEPSLPMPERARCGCAGSARLLPLADAAGGGAAEDGGAAGAGGGPVGARADRQRRQPGLGPPGPRHPLRPAHRWQEVGPVAAADGDDGDDGVSRAVLAMWRYEGVGWLGCVLADSEK